MQSLVLLFSKEFSSVEKVLSSNEISFDNQIGGYKRCLFSNNDKDSVIITFDDSILRDFDKEELSLIPFKVAAVCLFEYSTLAYGKSVLKDILFLLKGEDCYLDIDDMIMSGEEVYNKLTTAPDWDWR